VLISVLVLLSITMKMINNQSNQRVGSPYVMLKQFVIYLILGFLLLIAGLIVVEDISGYPISLIILISVIYYSYRLNTIYSVKIKSRVIYYHNLFHRGELPLEDIKSVKISKIVPFPIEVQMNSGKRLLISSSVIDKVAVLFFVDKSRLEKYYTILNNELNS
jgi:hypothetical protein